MQSFKREWEQIEYDGESISCTVSRSPNGEFEIAKNFSGGTAAEGYVFIRKEREFLRTHRIPEPRSADVANNGTYAIVDWIKYGASTGCRLTVRTVEGDIIFDHHTDASSGLTAISSNGEYVALCPYDGYTYVYSLPDGELVLRHQNEFDDRQQPRFVESNGRLELRFGEYNDTTEYYAISLSGGRIWESEEFERQHYFETVSLDNSVEWGEVLPKLVEDYRAAKSEEIKDEIANTVGDARLVEIELEETFEQIIGLLESRISYFKDEDHHRLVASTIAEASYRLAKSRKSSMGTNDAFWEALMKAEPYYQMVLPWYGGKQGIAKVRRLQGKVYMNRGEYSAALDCFSEIKEIAEASGTASLVNDADIRRIEELREQGAQLGYRPHGSRTSSSDVTWDFEEE